MSAACQRGDQSADKARVKTMTVSCAWVGVGVLLWHIGASPAGDLRVRNPTIFRGSRILLKLVLMLIGPKPTFTSLWAEKGLEPSKQAQRRFSCCTYGAWSTPWRFGGMPPAHNLCRRS